MNEEHGSSMNAGDDVATLLRLGGKRRQVPQDRTERVRAAVREGWQQTVRQRRKRGRRLRVGAGLAAAASLVLALVLGLLPFGGGAPNATVLVEALNGAAWSRSLIDGRPADPRPVPAGARVDLGSQLTTDDLGSIAVRLASGHSLRLDGATTVRLLDERSIALESGTLYVDSGLEGSTTGSIRVHTAFGVVEEIGTQFEVRLDADSVRLRLREGAVRLHHEGRVHRVEAGNEFELDSDSNVTRNPLPVWGPEWNWVAEVTPVLDLEGRTALEFLDWVSRERGLTLAFADVQVARSAETIELGGTVDRLTLDQALDAVLPTCRMSYRIDGKGTLLIAATDE